MQSKCCYTELRDLPNSKLGDAYYVSGRDTPGDGAHGFYLDIGELGTDDDGFRIKTRKGRLLERQGPLCVTHYGGKIHPSMPAARESIDDTSTILAKMRIAHRDLGARLTFPPGIIRSRETIHFDQTGMPIWMDGKFWFDNAFDGVGIWLHPNPKNHSASSTVHRLRVEQDRGYRQDQQAWRSKAYPVKFTEDDRGVTGKTTKDMLFEEGHIGIRIDQARSQKTIVEANGFTIGVCVDTEEGYCVFADIESIALVGNKFGRVLRVHDDVGGRRGKWANEIYWTGKAVSGLTGRQQGVSKSAYGYAQISKGYKPTGVEVESIDTEGTVSASSEMAQAVICDGGSAKINCRSDTSAYKTIRTFTGVNNIDITTTGITRPGKQLDIRQGGRIRVRVPGQVQKQSPLIIVNAKADFVIREEDRYVSDFPGVGWRRGYALVDEVSVDEYEKLGFGGRIKLGDGDMGGFLSIDLEERSRFSRVDWVCFGADGSMLRKKKPTDEYDEFPEWLVRAVASTNNHVLEMSEQGYLQYYGNEQRGNWEFRFHPVVDQILVAIRTDVESFRVSAVDLPGTRFLTA